MSGAELVMFLIFLVVAFAVTVKVLKWVLETLGRAVRAVTPFLLMAFGAFVLFSVFKADAANAATISVPTGVVVAAARASLIGF